MPWGFSDWLQQYGIPSTIAGFAVLGVLAGWLVPRYLYRQQRADLLPWKSVAETAMEANKEWAASYARLTATVDKLVEAQRDTEALVRSLVATTTTSRREHA
jgi:hypothetical protein